jgi:apurinic endonuclease APN1
MLMSQIGHCMKYSDEIGASSALRIVYRYGGSAAQICLGKSTDCSSLLVPSNEDVILTQRLINQHGFYLSVHGKLVYNFCRDNWTFQTNALSHEYRQAIRLGADLVIHQGKNIKELGLTEDEAVHKYVNVITNVLRKHTVVKGSRLLLENSARQGTELGYSVKQLAYIYKLIPMDLKDRVAFCMDTCHMFVSGEYNLAKPEESERFFQEFDKEIGLEHLGLIHFNDSSVPFNARNDSHAPLGRGYIGLLGLEKFSQLANERVIPIIMETGNPDIAEEISLVKSMILKHQ